MSAIGPGDFVECVRAVEMPPAWGDPLTLGAVYQVDQIKRCPWPCTYCGDRSGTAITLVGKRCDDHAGYCHCEFRPWPGPASSVEREALTEAPVSTPVPEGAE